MQPLIEIIALRTGISTDAAAAALETVADYIKEKYPLLSSTVDSVLSSLVPAEEAAA